MAVGDQYEKYEDKVLRKEDDATVYSGYDHLLKRKVAIKELSEHLRNQPALLISFWDEAEEVARLRHEHILQVITVDKQRGWIICEDVEGNLRRRIEEKPMAFDEVRSVLKQLLDALSFLQVRQKMHGHIKPDNILVKEGRVKLSDFLGFDLHRGLGQPTGDAKYLAPEMINPNFGKWGASADLYCLGFTSLELLLGPKFDDLFPQVTASPPELRRNAWMRWHFSEHERLKTVKELLPKIPEDLAKTIDGLICKEVVARFPSAKDAAKKLQEGPIVKIGIPDVESASTTTEKKTRKREAAFLQVRIGAKEWVLSSGHSNIVGKDRDNEIVLDGEAISRRHALLACVGRHWHAFDLHSREGTFVNDERISRQRLKTGDRVRFGDLEARVRLGYRQIIRKRNEDPDSDSSSNDSGKVLRRIGRFDVRQLVHAGQFAKYYLALWRDKNNHPVALKVFSAAMVEEDTIQRFVRGVQQAARIKESSIVRLFRAGRASGDFWFLAMEWMPGRSLRDILIRKSFGGQLPIGRAVRMALDVAGALEAAERYRVVHRNITPSAILFTAHGKAKLGDFSLAKESADAMRSMHQVLTQAGQVIGEYAFTAPEALNETAEPDLRGDIYSLACCVYQSIAGRPPYVARNSPELIQKVLHAEVESVRKFNAKVPQELDDLLLRSLARDPKKRQQSPAELLYELERLSLASEHQTYNIR